MRTSQEPNKSKVTGLSRDRLDLKYAMPRQVAGLLNLPFTGKLCLIDSPVRVISFS